MKPAQPEPAKKVYLFRTIFLTYFRYQLAENIPLFLQKTQN